MLTRGRWTANPQNHNPGTFFGQKLPPAPLANSRVSARRSPGWGGGDGRQVTVSRGGGGDCKGISRQTVVPSTDASKENTCEATFALMPMLLHPTQMLLRIQRNGKELLGTCVGCAGVWGCGAMGVTSGDSGDLDDSTATASSLES